MNTKVITHPIYGYKHLDPIPTNLEQYYQEQYRDPLHKNNEQAELEKKWLENGLYKDILSILLLHSLGNEILEIGCGSGNLLSYLRQQHNFDVTGIEPSIKVTNSEFPIYHTTFEEYTTSKFYDAIIMVNVLEHVADPIETLNHVKHLLHSDGMAIIRVPNDFSAIQLVARKELDTEPWWIAIPDHINYFNFDSLHKTLELLKFTIVHSQGDFPMEWFLLMGDDYINHPELGYDCHYKRIQFELSLPTSLRQQLYKRLAKMGMGRNCLVVARK